MNAVLFKNFSEEPFTGKWDSVPETFQPGESRWVEDWKGDHYAKHLIDRELNRQNIATNDQAKRTELRVQCFPPAEVAAPTEIMDKNVKKKKAEKEEEKEFAELEKDPDEIVEEKPKKVSRHKK